MAMTSPLALARIRASRIIPVPQDRVALGSLQDAASSAGRQLVDVQGCDGSRSLTLGWPDDFDQGAILGQDTWTGRQAPPGALLVLAACIRCCWGSADESLYPGKPAAEERVMEALERFTRGSSSLGMQGQRLRSGWKSGLRFLRACGFLASDEGDFQIRLGPEIATWSQADMRQLRDRYDDLPGAGGEAG
jgi:hypothetical protein